MTKPKRHFRRISLRVKKITSLSRDFHYTFTHAILTHHTHTYRLTTQLLRKGRGHLRYSCTYWDTDDPRARRLSHRRIWTPDRVELSESARSSAHHTRIPLHSPKCRSLLRYDRSTPRASRLGVRLTHTESRHPLCRCQ